MGVKQEKAVTRALQLYENADYWAALRAFERIQAAHPELTPRLRHYLAFCRRNEHAYVFRIGRYPPIGDLAYEAARKVRRASYWLVAACVILMVLGPTVLWEERETHWPERIVSYAAVGCIGLALFLLNAAFDARPLGGLFADKRLCKYCGHYTSYESPNSGGGLDVDRNSKCEQCGRSYPMPSAQWDTEEGMQYMYERGSVSDVEFYRDFEAQHPGVRRSEAARAVVGDE